MPQSGGGFKAKLDVNGGAVLWSLKYTSKASFRVDGALIREALAGAEGPGGKGNILPGITVYIGELDEEWSMLRTEDLMAILRGDIKLEAPPTKHETRRAAAMPAFLR